MWPKNSTAFLVIHGIGEQNPFESLDVFTDQLWSMLENKNLKNKVKGEHVFKKRGSWIENYVSLKIDKPKTAFVNIHEYYWAHITQRMVSFKNIIDWLLKTSLAARKFYKENVALAKKYKKMGVKAFRKNKMKKRWYLRYVWILIYMLRFFEFIHLPYFYKIVFKLFSKAKKIFVDYIGDLVIYTSSDVKSEFYEIRKRILDGAVEQIKTLLNDKSNKDIIIVGHSLGSVIAYDALNRINNSANVGEISGSLLKKIKGFVTFGSPLDKIAFFFREHSDDEEYIRRQILSNYHGFKNRNLNVQNDKRKLDFSYKKYLEHVLWLNFWDEKDPISGYLDFYELPKRYQIQLKQGKKYGFAHTTYWKFEKMYEDIYDYFFANDK